LGFFLFFFFFFFFFLEFRIANLLLNLTTIKTTHSENNVNETTSIMVNSSRSRSLIRYQVF